MAFNFNTAANLSINLELAPYINGRTSSIGTPATSPPWVLKDLYGAYRNTFKYTIPNRSFQITPDVTSINTKYLNPMDVGTFISQPYISDLQDITGMGYRVSNPAIADDFVYFACSDGYIYSTRITGTPPTFDISNSYRVEVFPIDYSVCRGTLSDDIVYIESPDVSTTGEYKLKYYSISQNKSFTIEKYTATSSFSAQYSIFRKDRLISFVHPDLGFIICYVSIFSSTILNVYDRTYTKIFDFDIEANVPWVSGSHLPFLKVSPNKKDVFIYAMSSGSVVKFSMSVGTYSYSYLSVMEFHDLDFGYGYGLSPSNVYLLNGAGSYSVWNVEKDKAGVGTEQYIYSYQYGGGYSPIYILTDSRNDPSETGYLFFGDGFVGTSSYNSGFGTMTNMYFAVTYSTATFSLIQGPYISGTSSVVGDYTLGINCMIVIDGPSDRNTISNAPVSHILQYYNIGNQLLVFNTSRGKVSETISATDVSLNNSSTEYNLVKFRDDDVYILVDQTLGQFQWIYW